MHVKGQECDRGVHWINLTGKPVYVYCFLFFFFFLNSSIIIRHVSFFFFDPRSNLKVHP